MLKLCRTTVSDRFQLPLLFLVAAAALIVGPSGASAATQIGETFDPTGNCIANFTRLQSVSPANSYAAPSAGVITRWSYDHAGDPSSVPNLKFKVGRAAPGADLTMPADFTIIGESGVVTPDPNTLNSYPVRIAVQAGDVIGIYNETAGLCQRDVIGYTEHYRAGDVEPGETEEFTPLTTVQLDVSAILEADCDKDGRGDETQDGNLSSCTPVAGVIPTPRTCRGQRVNIVGTPGADEIVGTPGVDVIAALAGNDKVFAFGGNDLVCGNNGADKIRGGPGNDVLKGNHGNDTLRGKRGNDILRGGKQNDTCFGGKGDDTEKSC
jgi:hypothetical protein